MLPLLLASSSVYRRELLSRLHLPRLGENRPRIGLSGWDRSCCGRLLRTVPEEVPCCVVR